MKRTVSIAILSMLIAGPMSAMQPLAARTATQLAKHYAKKGFSGTMTGLHWAIALGQPFVQGIQNAMILYDENKFFKNFENVDGQITDFIKSELQKTHNKEIDAVKIHPLYAQRSIPMGTWNKHILLAPSTAQELTKALQANDQETIDKWRAILQHEGSHIKNNDLVLRAAANIALPFVTHGSVKAIRNLIPIAKKTRSFLGEQLIKIPTALGKNAITTNATMAMYRYQEQRADESISNDINLLNGFKRVLCDIESATVEHLAQFNLSPELMERCRWVDSFGQEHPLPKKRIERIDQRIALLEQSQENVR